MNKAALFFLGLVAVGAAAFFALRADESPSGAPETVGLTLGNEDDTAGTGTPEDPDLGTPDAQVQTTDRELASTTVADVSEGTPRLDGSSLAASLKPSTGTIVGRVTDANGAAIANAEIKVARRDLEDLFMGERLVQATGRARSTRSNRDGRFSLTAPVGNLRLGIEADQFAPFTASASVSEGQEEDLGDVRLAAGVTLSGRVVDEDGNGVADAKLIREPDMSDGITVLGGPEDVVATTDAGGAFLISRQASGPYELVVTHSDHPSGRLQGETERPGETTSGLEVVLQDGVVVRGMVKGPQEELSGLTVVANLGEVATHDFDFSITGRQNGSGQVQPDGSFEIRGLKAAADYFVVLNRGKANSFGSNARRSQAVSFVTPQVGLGPELQLTYSTGAKVTFAVTDPSGAPMAPGMVEAGFEFEFNRPNAIKDAEAGLCELDGLWPQEGGQELNLKLSKKGFEDWEAQNLLVYPDGVVDLGKIALVARPSVLVTVLDDVTGEPVAGARVSMGGPKKESATRSIRVNASFSSDGDDSEGSQHTVFDGQERQTGRTDGDGVVSLDATAGELVDIQVEDGAHAPATVGPIQLPEVMTVFEQEVRLTPGGGLRVTVLDPSGVPASGHSLEIDGEDMESAAMRSERTGDDGVALLQGLSAGPQRIRLGKRGGGNTMVMPRIRMDGFGGDADDDDTWTEVTVLPGEVVEVALSAPAIGSLKGKVLELGRVLAGAEVKLRKAGGDNPLEGMIMFGGPGSPSATSDARGEFHIVDVEAGEYELVVDHKTRAMPYVHDMTMEGGEQEVSLDLSVTEVTGVVVDENGDPLAGARVEAERAAEESGTSRTAVRMVMMTDNGGGSVMMSTGMNEAEPTITDGEGRYRLRGVTAGVRLKVNATADGYDKAESEPFSVPDGSIESDVDVQFKKSGSIRVEVEGLTGRAIAMLRRTDAPMSAQPKIQMLTGESTTIDALAPGEWNVRIQGIGSQSLATDPGDLDVNVEGGETVVASFKVP
jgi:protocatechuate 3,4-dioxygenase beta subunit